MTALDVFDRAMHLSDNGDENSGKTDITDNKEYKNRTLAIINILINELYPYSDTFQSKGSGKRATLAPLTDFETDIDLDDYCCGTVLPYGLAANLFTDENTTIASFYEQRYEELLNRLKEGFGMQAEAEAVTNVYGDAMYDADGNIIGYGGNGIGFEWTTRWW